jgi:hypothetical protein
LAEEKEWHIGYRRAEDVHIHASISSDERNSVPCAVLRSKYRIVILCDQYRFSLPGAIPKRVYGLVVEWASLL